MSDTLFQLRNESRTWLVYTCIICLLTIAFFGSLKDHLLGVDDADTFRNNIAINQDFSFFFSPEKEAASGRLVDELIMWLTYCIWGNDPAVFHVLIVVCHALASLFLSWLFYQLGSSLEVSLLGGILFLVNIAHVQTVHWISALEYPLALLAVVLAMHFHTRFVAERRPLPLAAFYLAAILCVLTHPVAAIVWPLSLYWAWIRGFGLKATLGYLMPLMLLLSLVLLFTLSISGTNTTTRMAMDAYSWRQLGAHDSASPFSLLQNTGQVLLWLLGRLVSAAHWYPSLLHQQAPWESWVGIPVLVGLVVLLLKNIHPASMWAGWILLSLAPFLPATLVHAGIARYLYLATAGSCFLIAWMLSILGLWLERRRAHVGRCAYGVVVLVVLVSSYGAQKKAEFINIYDSGRYYLSTSEAELGIQLLERAIAGGGDVLPLNDAYFSLIDAKLRHGSEYLPILHRAFAEMPDDLRISLLMAVEQYFNGDEQRKQAGEQKIRRLGVYAADTHQLTGFFHTTAIVYQHYGIWFSKHHDYDKALAAFRLSYQASPESTYTLRSIMRTLIYTKRYAEAAALTPKVLQSFPENHDLLFLSALSLKKMGEIDQALEFGRRAQLVLTQAIGKDPNNAGSYVQLAHIWRDLDQNAKAIEILEKAIVRLPAVANLHLKLGNLYHRSGQFERADQAYENALRLEPENGDIRSKLIINRRQLSRLPQIE